MVYSLYADETVFLNTVINYFLYLASFRLLHLPLSRFRLWSAAFLSSLYALFALLPSLAPFYIAPAKLFFALLFSLIAYGFHRRVFSLWALFIALSLLFGGAVTALSLLYHASSPIGYSGVVFVPASLRAAAAIAAGVYFLASLLFQRLLSARGREICLCEVFYGGRHVSFPLLFDTGAGVYDPANGLAVPVVSREVLRPLFTEADFLLLSSLPPTDAVMALEKSGVPFGLLPVTTAAGSALLLTFRAERLTFGGQAEKRALVAFSEREFPPDGGFSGVIAPL